MSDATVESPCIGVCALDEASGLCMGCYRTPEEIQDWWNFDNAAKQKVVDLAEERQQTTFDN